MNQLRRLARALRCAGHEVLSDSVRAGAAQWETPFPWRFDVDGDRWSVGWTPALGWHATDGESVVTCSGVIVGRDDPPDGHHTIRIPSTHWAALSDIGQGNASQALRDAVVSHLAQHGRLL